MFESKAIRAAVAGTVCTVILMMMLVLHAWPLWTGRPIYLKAEPVDPRDVMRGDYVALRYDINRLRVSRTPDTSTAPEGPPLVRPVGEWWDAIEKESRPVPAGKVLYLQLEPLESDAAGVPNRYRPVTISDRLQDAPVNLRGRVRSAVAAGQGHALVMEYGIEALYVEEGAGTPIERALLDRKTVYAEIAVAASGRARLTDLIIDGRPVSQSPVWH